MIALGQFMQTAYAVNISSAFTITTQQMLAGTKTGQGTSTTQATVI
jgi:hypothetical protein